MPLLANHTAVITGAGSGIGRAIALGYAREGARVVALDVTDRAACVAMAKQIADTVGPVSILVNNAGIARRNGMTGAADAVIKDWEDVIAINLTGVFNVTHAFLGSLRATKGRIVN